ncbi:MAG: phosphoribosyltransferase [Candidatus Micrarchaeota archaeon]
MEFLSLSWEQMEKLCENIANKVKKYEPDILIGVSRGGLVPVRILSDVLDNRNVAIIKIEFYKTINETHGFPKVTQPLALDVKGKKVLVVDDVSDTGRSLAVAKDYLARHGAKEIRFATLHYKPKSIFKPDYFIDTTDKWIVYPWEVRETERELKKKKKE